jgi:hypothetical protein
MIGPYSESDWQRDVERLQAGPLACPDCGHTESFAPMSRPSIGTLEIHYRGCKVCGFWQIADGQSAPFRCRMTAHMCLGQFPAARVCRGCGNPMPAGVTYHPCLRVLRPEETRECPECHTQVGGAHVVPWAVTRP